MKRRLNSTDLVFAITLVCGLIFLGMFIFGVPYSHDETFYLSVPVRLVNGDSLVKNEWHLTQFSSLFSYLPALIWIKATGSTEGIFIFTRCIYLLVQAILTTAVYIFFRKRKLWAVIAAILYFTQFINIMWQISYHTMFVAFLLLLTFFIITIYKSKATYLYVFAGLCYGASCICNPVFCLAFVFYLISCAIWKRKETLMQAVSSKLKPRSQKTASNKKTTAKKKSSSNQPISSPDSDSYNCLFSKEAITYLFAGILISAVIAISFFFLTGGSISALINNIDNLLAFSEYDTTGSVFTVIESKISLVIREFNSVCFNKSYILFLGFIVLFLDKKRTNNSHRIVYVILSFLYLIIHSIAIFQKVAFGIYFIEFPFLIFSLISYVLTTNKNKVLFNCMWIPCLIGAVFHLFSSNSLLSAANGVFIINNIAGVFFVADLFKEIASGQEKILQKGFFIRTSQLILCLSLCLQLVSHLTFYQISMYTPDSNNKVSVGPYAGIHMTDEQFDDYTKTINDLDYIKSISNESSPLYIVAHQNWMYLYADRPVGISTTYYLGEINPTLLHTYYAENPDRVPKYVYLPLTDYFDNVRYDCPIETYLPILSEIFDFYKTDLSNGILLTVTKYKPPLG